MELPKRGICFYSVFETDTQKSLDVSKIKVLELG